MTNAQAADTLLGSSSLPARSGARETDEDALWSAIYNGAAEHGTILHDDTVTAIQEAVLRNWRK